MRQSIDSLKLAGWVFGLAMVAMPQVAHSATLIAFPVRQSGSIAGVGTRVTAAKGAVSHTPGYLGILFQNLSNEQDMPSGVKGGKGVEVVMVDHDGPAGKAGLQEHDVSGNQKSPSSRQAIQKFATTASFESQGASSLNRMNLR